MNFYFWLTIFWLVVTEIVDRVATVTIDDRVLVVLKCETRTSDSYISEFQEIWKESAKPLQLAGIPIVNVCHAENWEELGYLTKPKMYLRALCIFSQYYESSLLNYFHRSDVNLYNQSNLHVLLIDSDTFWSLESIDQLWKVYDSVRGHKHLVVSSEATCWIGHPCNLTEISRWYGDDSRAQTGSISSFVNSGVIMGQVGEVMRMLEYVVQHNLSYITEKGSFDDQYAITDYVKSIAADRVVIDYKQQLSGSCVFPVPFDPQTEIGPFTCRSDSFDVSYNCHTIGLSILDMNYFQVNQTSCRIYRRFETWEGSEALQWLFMGLDPSPLIWHGHGKSYDLSDLDCPLKV